MLSIDENGVITLTRGDTAYISVNIQNDVSSEPYTVKEDDTLRLTVKKQVTDKNIAFQKVVKGVSTFIINPEDTKDLAFDKYKYDVELTTATGEVFTVVPPTAFVIDKEVTW